MNENSTLVRLLYERSETDGNQVAYRYKELGIWNEVTWGEFRQQVESIALELESMAIAHLAVQSVGGIPMGVFELYADHLKEALVDFKPKVVFIGGVDHHENLASIQENVPFIEQLIDFDETTSLNDSAIPIRSFQELLQAGEIRNKDQPNFLTERIEEFDPIDVALMVRESTGKASTVELTHKEVIEAAQRICESENIEALEDYLPILSLATMNEYLFTIALSIYKGTVSNFPEKPNTVLKDFIEIAPQHLVAPPRVYQKIRSEVTVRLKDATWFKRQVFQYFDSVKHKTVQAKFNGDSSGDLMGQLSDLVIFQFIRKHYGFHRMKTALVSRGMIDEETYVFFHKLGIPVRHTYSAADVGGIATIQESMDFDRASLGIPLSGVNLSVEDERVTINSQQTGHYGEVNDGRLYVFGHETERITLLSGEASDPMRTENRLKESLYIKEAVCFGEKHQYLTAILNIDFDTVSRWADQEQLAFTTYEDLAKHERVIELIGEEVSQLMSELPEKDRVRNFVLLPKMMTEEDGELTNTLQVKRAFVSEKYHELIDLMYSKQMGVQPVDETDEEASLSFVTLDSEGSVS